MNIIELKIQKNCNIKEFYWKKIKNKRNYFNERYMKEELEIQLKALNKYIE